MRFLASRRGRGAPRRGAARPHAVSCNIRREARASEVVGDLDGLFPRKPKIIGLQETQLWSEPEFPEEWVPLIKVGPYVACFYPPCLEQHHKCSYHVSLVVGVLLGEKAYHFAYYPDRHAFTFAFATGFAANRSVTALNDSLISANSRCNAATEGAGAPPVSLSVACTFPP